MPPSGPARDFIGYAGDVFDPKWPGNKRLAVQFVINYEEGGESCVLDGDATSEHLLSDLIGATPVVGGRYLNIESLYDRAGFWRLHRLFTERKVPVTVYAVGLALEKNPAAARAMMSAGWEIASHGYRWINYQQVDEATEREHIRKTIAVHERIVGKRPVGLYQGTPTLRTRRLVVEEGGFLYDSDAYNDDLPYWSLDYGRPHLVIPYTLVNNDMKFVALHGFSCGEQFFSQLKDAFDVLLAEGRAGRPKMMSIGLHCRIVAHPARFSSLVRFLDYIEQFETDIWICRREDIARHWYKHHFPTVAPAKL
ncbi:hypothetical protein ATCC90586_002467 [Pythium insidiosum]|nr:hypothetical protein ATCC90586_002467 [Pythium insidiosum]